MVGSSKEYVSPYLLRALRSEEEYLQQRKAKKMPEVIDFPRVNYAMLPEHMRKSARNYIEEGVLVGGFLSAVLENRFVQAWARADDINRANLETWARWLYNEVPASAWGSEENVNTWIEKKRGKVVPIGFTE